MSLDTQVSKSSPAIKQIIAATVGSDWTGKKVVIREVPASWEFTQYIDDKLNAWYLNLDTLSATGQVRVWSPEQPRYGGPNVVMPAPKSHEALVLAWRVPRSQGMEIIIREDAIDPQAVAVAADALLRGGKQRGAEAAAATRLCGATGGLCFAIAEAQAKTFQKGERFGDLTGALVSTSETRAAKREKKTAQQLEREIAVALAHRR